ncbi:MAG: hypothetical protein C4523_15340 [Myxococcales bacterium]|nr:MAG: hypothetical protein C4523_15340 [Myxococcales bacterium]
MAKKSDLLRQIAEGRRELSAMERLFPSFANLDLTEEDVNALTRAERETLLRRLDYRRKYQLLVKSDDLVPLVRGMPPEDLYYTIEAAGRTDAMDLVVAATPEQVTHLLDMTCWAKDQFLPEEILDWFGYMILHEPEAAMRKIRALDPELVILLLSRFIKVRRYEWSDDRNEIDEDRLATLDEYYHFEFIDPDSPKTERLIVFLRMLYKLNHDLYMRAMETLIWELPSNLEELTLRAHADRLADRGYPAYLDAIAILAPLDPETYKRESGLESRKRTPAPTVELPGLYHPLLAQESLLARALASLDEPARFGLRDELVYLANRLLVAREALTDLDQVKETLREANSTLSLGLEYLADGDLARAALLCETAPFQDVFRVGYSLVLRLHHRAGAFQEKWLVPYGRRAASLVAQPVRDLVGALMQRPPRYWEGAELDGAPVARPFQTLDELARAEKLLGRVEFLFDLHFRLLAQNPEEILAGPLDVAVEPLDPELRFAKIFLTVFANAASGREPAYRPLSPGDLEARLAEWFVADGKGGHRLRDDLPRLLSDWLGRYVAREAEVVRSSAAAWAERCLDALDRLAAGLPALARGEAVSLSQLLLLA